MNALALGGADCLWDDVAASEDLLGEGWWDITSACNRAGVDWPGRLDHWCSLHPEKLLHFWAPKREADDYTTWSDPNRGAEEPAKTDRLIENWGGSSGLMAVQVALEAGATRVVCCGIPMGRQPHYHGRADWTAFDAYRDAWERNLDTMDGRVRSMSGWTKELLGAPTPEWLAAEAVTA